jgi:uncharacterized protein (TIGR02145 family)
MKKKIGICFYTCAMVGVFLLFTCSVKGQIVNDTICDIDGNVYHTVTIGKQVWMVENLKTTKYQNGDPIQEVIENAEWKSLTSGAQCVFKNDLTFSEKNGRLYNWYAVIDGRNIAPKGWHVPTEADWSTLNSYVAYNLGISGTIAKSLASNVDWPNYIVLGTVGNDLSKNNSSGFTGLPGGTRSFAGKFDNVVSDGKWWTSTESNKRNAWYRSLSYGNSVLIRMDFDKKSGYSVRCVKD